MLGALAVLLAASTAGAPTPSGVGNRLLEAMPGQTLRYSVGDDVVVADVNRDGLSGTHVNLRRSPGRLTGSVGTEPVTLKLEPNRLDGHIGDNPIGLDVFRSGDAQEDELQIVGQFGNRAVALDVRANRVDGQVGPCSLRLAPDQGIYFGQMSCGGPPRQVRLTVPVSLVARPDDELAAMLVAILAR
jgi:hypothetical protein